MTTTKSNVFTGGVPTAPEIKRLREAFADRLVVGEIIPHTEIEAVLGIDRRTKYSRYYTIVGAWRRQILVEQNVDTDAVVGAGYRVLAEGERVRVSLRDHRQGVRKVGRSVSRIARVQMEQLPEPERKNAEHAARLMQGSLASLRGAAKEIAIRFAPPEPNPRLPRGGK